MELEIEREIKGREKKDPNEGDKKRKKKERKGEKRERRGECLRTEVKQKIK